MCSLMRAAVSANVRSSPVSPARWSASAWNADLHVLEQQREVEDLGVLLGGRARERGFGVLAEHDSPDERRRRARPPRPRALPCASSRSSRACGAGSLGNGSCRRLRPPRPRARPRTGPGEREPAARAGPGARAADSRAPRSASAAPARRAAVQRLPPAAARSRRRPAERPPRRRRRAVRRARSARRVGFPPPPSSAAASPSPVCGAAPNSAGVAEGSWDAGASSGSERVRLPQFLRRRRASLLRRRRGTSRNQYPSTAKTSESVRGLTNRCSA